MEFKENLKKYQDIVNSELEKYIRKQECPEQVLNQSMEYSLMAGGKRLRPILVIATYELFKQDYEKCMSYAMAIEMVHNFSLIHDDLPGIDNDDFRHGKLTNHKKFNEATAILAGDGLLNQAYIVISDEISKTVNDKNRNCTVLQNKVRAFNEFSKAVDRMIAGEYIDTELEGKEISPELLEYIHVNKTGALLKLCVRMGAILADASEEDIQKQLDRRKPGQSKFTTKRNESDTAQILSGVFEGKTTGTPISVIVYNQDQRSRDYGKIKDCYRPGHADI